MAPPQGYNLVWSDDFSGTSLDKSKWHQTIGPSSNVKVANNKLILIANPIGDFNGSAFISTSKTFQYGYYECSAQISTVQGIAFAFWLLDPGGSSPEIDIVERPGNAPGYQNICVFSAKGTDGKWASGGVHQSFPATATGFHKYALLWTPTELTFYVDDVKGWSAPPSVVSKCNVPLNIKLDICAGGCSFQGITIPTNTTGSTSAQVEYVRVYQQGAPPVIKYKCSGSPNFACVSDNGDGTGIYATLAECQADCKAPTAIIVTNPSAGVIYKVGDPRIIRWKHSPGTGVNVKIELLKTGAPIKIISPSTPNDNAFAWTVPDVTSGTDYQIKVTSMANIQTFGIGGKFTIRGTVQI